METRDPIMLTAAPVGLPPRFWRWWLADSASLLGSGLTAFAIAAWLYARTGSVTHVSATQLAAMLPLFAVTPLAGVVADRVDRRVFIAACDAVAACAAALLTLIVASSHVNLVAICSAIAVISSCAALRTPIFVAAIATLVPPTKVGRVSGLLQVGNAAAALIGPLLGGMTVAAIGIAPVLAIDAATFILAASAAMLCGRLQRSIAPPAADGRHVSFSHIAIGSLFRDMPGARRLLGVHAVWSFAIGAVHTLATVRFVSLAPPAVAGGAMAASSSGLLVGALAIAISGGPRQRVRAAALSHVALGIAIVIAGATTSLVAFAMAAFAAYLAAQVGISSLQAFWMQHVRHELQGRLTALRQFVGAVSMAVAMAVVGPVADAVKERLGVADSTQAVLRLEFAVLGSLLATVSLLILFDSRVRMLDAEPRREPPMVAYSSHSGP